MQTIVKLLNPKSFVNITQEVLRKFRRKKIRKICLIFTIHKKVLSKFVIDLFKYNTNAMVLNETH